jgi:hypothetical protein
VTDKLTEAPLANIPVVREGREVRLLAKLLDGFANPIRPPSSCCWLATARQA